MASLLAAVEGLPIGFVLSTARKDRPGFPVMFVNKHFEKMTGYRYALGIVSVEILSKYWPLPSCDRRGNMFASRKDIIGVNCKFLQCDESEKDQIAGKAVNIPVCNVIRG
jgi:hypothetical protein